jgi:hypothetical protein
MDETPEYDGGDGFITPPEVEEPEVEAVAEGAEVPVEEPEADAEVPADEPETEDEVGDVVTLNASTGDAITVSQFRVTFYPTQVQLVVEATSADRAVSEARASLVRISEGDATPVAL